MSKLKEWSVKKQQQIENRTLGLRRAIPIFKDTLKHFRQFFFGGGGYM